MHTKEEEDEEDGAVRKRERERSWPTEEGRTEGRTGRVIMPQDKQAGESGARLSRQANQNGGSKRKKERIGGDCYPYRKSHRRG